MWETPPDLFEFGCDLFNFKPEIDFCATKHDKKCELYYGLNEKYNHDNSSLV